MSLLPAKTAISDTYPLPSNATARAGFAALWDSINEFFQKSELDLASATTCDIGGQLSTKLRITGTTTITSFGTNYRGPILLRFVGIVTLTHNSTTLRCPGASNIVTTAGDLLLAWPTATVSGTLDGWQVVILARGDGAVIGNLATPSSAGRVELATDAEAQAATDGTRAVTPDNLGAVVLGLGQTWQNMTASRAMATTYTNSTGRPIQISMSGLISLGDKQFTLAINGANALVSNGSYAAGSLINIQGVVIPNGATYSVTASGGTVSSLSWWELR